MVQMLQAGMLLMTIGEPTSLQDWCHVDNLVQAQVRGRRAGRLCGRCVWCVCVCEEKRGDKGAMLGCWGHIRVLQRQQQQLYLLLL